MDEILVWFNMTSVYTVNPKEEKTVHIRATGNEKNRFTIVLTIAAGIHFFFIFFLILTFFFFLLFHPFQFFMG